MNLIGRYSPGPSCIHRLDPALKVLLFASLVASTILSSSFLGYLVLLSLIVVCARCARLSARSVLAGITDLRWLILTIVALNALFFSSEEPLLSLGFFSVTAAGLDQGLTIAARVCIVMTLANILMSTTRPQELVCGMRRLMSPLSLVRFPVDLVALMVGVAIQFIPTLLRETDQLIKAQKARGAMISAGSLVERGRTISHMLIPVFVAAFRRADDLSLAMEARGYRFGSGYGSSTGREGFAPSGFVAMGMCLSVLVFEAVMPATSIL